MKQNILNYIKEGILKVLIIVDDEIIRISDSLINNPSMFIANAFKIDFLIKEVP